MKVQLGTTTAHCARCGGEDFDRLEPPATCFRTTVQCSVCGKTTTDGALLVQISSYALAEARAHVRTRPA
jgi:hypothetical protein